MKITPEEIASIEEIGSLNQRPVRLVKLKGGFHIAIGKKKGALSEEAIGAGSHPAIVKYNLEKQYPDYQPAMMKSEANLEPSVEKHSHFLGEELRKNGYDIYSVQEGSAVSFHVTKHNSCVSTVRGSLDEYNLLLHDLNVPKEFVKGLAGATTEKALSCKVGLSMRK